MEILETALARLRAKYPRATFVIDDVPDDNRTLYEGPAAGAQEMEYLLDNKVIEVDESDPKCILIRIEEEYPD